MSFKFLKVVDYGHTFCPHCGSEGRYIYYWEENGKGMEAMAGCYEKLSSHVHKNEEDRYFESLAKKIAKGKELNGWDKSIVRLMKFKEEGKYPERWCNIKIQDVLQQRKAYLKGRR